MVYECIDVRMRRIEKLLCVSIVTNKVNQKCASIGERKTKAILCIIEVRARMHLIVLGSLYL